LINSGHGIIFKVTEDPKIDASERFLTSASLTNGPLAYTYTLSHLMFHHGKDINKGSEHTLSGFRFPGEIQFYAYNSHLYSSFEEAASHANGIVAVSVLLQLSQNLKQANGQLKRIAQALKNITSIGKQLTCALCLHHLLTKPIIKKAVNSTDSINRAHNLSNSLI
jgi:hypothetical protein